MVESLVNDVAMIIEEEYGISMNKFGEDWKKWSQDSTARLFSEGVGIISALETMD